jgi:hypothetical protein
VPSLLHVEESVWQILSACPSNPLFLSCRGRANPTHTERPMLTYLSDRARTSSERNGAISHVIPSKHKRCIYNIFNDALSNIYSIEMIDTHHKGYGRSYRGLIWDVTSVSWVRIATGYGLDGRGSISFRGKQFLSSPQRPDRLWGRPSLLFNGHRGLPGGKAAGPWSWPLISI